MNALCLRPLCESPIPGWQEPARATWSVGTLLQRPPVLRVLLLCPEGRHDEAVARWGHEVPSLALRSTSDLYSALSRVAAGLYHAVVVDMGIYGPTAVRQLQSACQGQPRVAVLGLSGKALPTLPEAITPEAMPWVLAQVAEQWGVACPALN
jgi:hypothetical protein